MNECLSKSRSQHALALFPVTAVGIVCEHLLSQFEVVTVMKRLQNTVNYCIQGVLDDCEGLEFHNRPTLHSGTVNIAFSKRAP